MAATIRLTVLTGPHQGDRYCFRERGSMTLGRASACDVCFCGVERDQRISRRHCQVTFDPPTVFVEDLGSSNGTYINGHSCPPTEAERAAPVIAESGAILTIGGTSLRVDLVDGCEWDGAGKVKRNCPVSC